MRMLGLLVRLSTHNTRSLHHCCPCFLQMPAWLLHTVPFIILC